MDDQLTELTGVSEGGGTLQEDIRQMKYKFGLSVLLCVMVLLTAGATVAWLWNYQKLNTVALVQMPSRITLSGANRSELQRISLELTADDTQDEDQVTIRRVFCIESTADYWLEVVRTTNIENLSIRIFPVKASNSDLTSGVVKGTDGTKAFYYTPDSDSLDGAYLNQAENGGLAIQKDGVGTLHSENYEDEDTVQQNAEPLYWRTRNAEEYHAAGYSTAAPEADGTYYRYYVLELKWNTSAHETDLIYLLVSH